MTRVQGLMINTQLKIANNEREGMRYPAIDELSTKADSKYKLVIAVAERAREIKAHLQFPFVFRRLQSLQLLLPAHLCLPLSFPTSLGHPFHGLLPLPFYFLTPAVSAFFRPLQFWVLTTQPLFFLSFSSRFHLTVVFPVPVSALASSVSSFSPA